MEGSKLNGFSIKTRVIFLAMTPLLIISLILGYHLARSRIQDSEKSLHERGETLARHIARESEFGLFSEDTRQLGELASMAVHEEDVYEITIQNSDGRTVAHAYSYMPGRSFSDDAARGAHLMRFIYPVFRSGVTISDNEEQYKNGSETSLTQGVVIGWIELKISRAQTLARQGAIIRNIILLTLLSSILCALIALWMARGIVKPILRLSHAVEGIRSGRLGTRVSTDSSAEIGELENGFNEMAAAMEKSQTRLHDEIANTTNKLSLLLESLSVAVFRAKLSDQCRISFITPSIKQLTGFDAEEFDRDCILWMQRIHPDDKGRIQQDLSLLRLSGAHEFEYRWQTKDGGYQWFYSYIRLHGDSSSAELSVIGIWQDISELKKVSQQLEHTIRILQEKNHELNLSRNEAVTASRNKATFLANMSHEIRTPLSSIIGYAAKMEARLKTVDTDDELKQCARIINHASAQLKHIIDDILSFSKLESGSVHLDQAPFDLRSNFENVICMMTSELGDKKVELSLLFDSDAPTLLIGDPGRVNQVLMNLLSNAIKFTWNGYVDVHVSARDTTADRVELEISVADTGIGMTEDVIKNIFNPFQQGDASIARRYGGTGLGLSIVSRLIELWDGRLGVESSPGNGSRFWFTLKCLRQDTADDFIADACIRRKKILLYDDHLPSLRAARNLLLSWSASVYQARSRCQIKPMICAAAASEEPYDAIIIGAGIKEDEPGGIALNVLISLIRESHDVPLLLMINRQRPIPLDLTQNHDVRLVEKPVRRDVFYQNLRDLLKLNVLQPDAPVTEDTSDHPGLYGLRVLLAEDNEFNRALITAILEARGLIVTQVNDGAQALARAAHEDYDLVVMDIHLPGMDGTEAARHIRILKSSYRTVPIIALTADVFFDAPANLASAGIDACLLKPLDEDKLWRLINSLRFSRTRTRAETSVVAARDGRGHGGDLKEMAGLAGRLPVIPSPELTEILPALADSLDELRERLGEALQEADSASLRAIIHELKGVVCYFGISELSQNVLEAEKLLNSGTGPENAATTLRKVRRQISDFIASHSERLREANHSE